MSFETDFQRSSTLADAAEPQTPEHMPPEPHNRRVMQTPEQRMPGWQKVSDVVTANTAVIGPGSNQPRLPDGFVDNDHDGMG